MPIKPIDLQTLFTQMDKVGRERAAAKDGAVIQGAILASVAQKKESEKSESVTGLESSEDHDGALAVGDRDAASDRGREEGGKRREKADEDDEGREVIRDPDLGNSVDISG